MQSFLKHLLIIGSLFICLQANAQLPYFNKLYPGSGFGASSIIEVNDGYIVAGNKFNPTYAEIIVSKLSYNGDTLWQKIYGNAPLINNISKITEAGNGYVVLGTVLDSATSNNRDIVLVKFNVNGDTLWSRRYGSNRWEAGRDIKQTTDGGFIIVGERTVAAGSQCFYYIKTDSLGNLEWEKIHGGGVSVAFSVVQTDDGGYMLAGHSSNNGTYDILVLKTYADGTPQREKYYNFDNVDFSGYISKLKDGNYVITSNSNDGSGNRVARLMKIDVTGNIIWQKQYSLRTRFELQTPAVESIDGTLLAAGFIVDTQQARPKGCLIKTSAQGDTIWTRTYYTRSDRDNYIYDIAATSDNGFIFCGSAFDTTSSPVQDTWVVKLDCGGCDGLQCNTPDSVCSAITSTNEPVIQQQANLLLYPNPSQGSVTIIYKAEGTAEVAIYNTLGAKVQQFTFKQGSNTVEASGLSAGIYFVVLSENGKTLATQKLVIIE